jgi:MinD superfamily P-loop ATPase
MSVLSQKKIAIASGKGGTGKTMLSVNLASYLSKNQRVLLADLDVEEPNCLLLLNGSVSEVVDACKMIPVWDENTCTFCGLCTENCRFHALARLGPQIMVFKELCHSCYACSELCPEHALPMVKETIGQITHVEDINLFVVEGKLKIGEEQATPMIEQTLSYVAKHYHDSDIQILDCPPGNSCPLVAAVRDADFVILVTEPTPFGLNDLRIAVETVRVIGKKMGVVINKDGLGDKGVENFCSENNIPILGRIKYDKRIASLYAEGEMIFNKIGHMNQALADIIFALEKEVEQNG